MATAEEVKRLYDLAEGALEAHGRYAFCIEQIGQRIEEVLEFPPHEVLAWLKQLANGEAGLALITELLTKLEEQERTKGPRPQPRSAIVREFLESHAIFEKLSPKAIAEALGWDPQVVHGALSYLKSVGTADNELGLWGPTFQEPHRETRPAAVPDEEALRAFSLLPEEFEAKDLSRALGCKPLAVSARLTSWREQGLIVSLGQGKWRKVS